MQKKIFFIAGLLALATIGYVLGADIENRIVRYRIGTVLSMDPTVILKDEDGNWTNTAANFQNLASLTNLPVNANSSGIIQWPINAIMQGTFTASSTLASLAAIHASKGYWWHSNSMASWPAGAQVPGDAWVGNSNGVLYVLTSLPGSTNWAATNKWFP